MAAKLFDPLYGGLQQVLDLRTRQHAMTATNLANADTPGFKAKYLDFQSALAEAVGTDEGLAMRATRPGHFGADPSAADAPLVEVEAPPWAVDGNSVFAEKETARLATNQLFYTGVSRGISKRFALLKFAASDGKR